MAVFPTRIPLNIKKPRLEVAFRSATIVLILAPGLAACGGGNQLRRTPAARRPERTLTVNVGQGTTQSAKVQRVRRSIGQLGGLLA